MASKHCLGCLAAKLTCQLTNSSRYLENAKRQMTILALSTSARRQRHRLSLSQSSEIDNKKKDMSMNLSNTLIQNGVKNNMAPKLPPLWKRMTKQEFADIVEKHLGIVTVCCNVLDCTYSQFWQAASHWDLRDFVREQKAALVSKAEQTIAEKLDSHFVNVFLKAAEIVLKSQAAREQGWGSQPQVQVNTAVVLTEEQKAQKLKDIFGI